MVLVAAAYQRGSLDVASARTPSTIIARGDRLAARAARAMRRRGQHRPQPLAAPAYPPAVLAELKRADVAVHTPRSLTEIGHALGMRPGVVRARARVASLLPPGTLDDIPVPKRRWAEVEHDRQVAFAAQVHQAQQQFGLTRAEVRRAVKRVRGLTGSC